jgi:3-oxoacyl-[acyl-carrier protein] reductase
MLIDRTAVITGAGRGIGKAIALQMAKNGANIAIIDYAGQETLDAVCRELSDLGVKAAAYNCNVTDFTATKSVCEQIVVDFGSVDILVNNAGITKDNLILRMTEDEFDQVIAVNLKGAFHMMKHLARYLMKSPAGRIINISSVSGLMGNPGQANYSASKAGLVGLTKTAAKELAARNVTCNAIAPGFIETDMTVSLPQAVLDQVQTAIPLKRMGQAAEVAALAVFLASDQSAYITGEVIRVDGGMCM